MKSRVIKLYRNVVAYVLTTIEQRESIALEAMPQESRNNPKFMDVMLIALPVCAIFRDEF